MQAEIIAIGDEIISGQSLDTNSQWLSRRLEEAGVRVICHTTVGDELDACADAFRQAIARADLVVATGGLGPTADDLTREAIAEATGRELVLNEHALEAIRRLFQRHGYEMPKRNEQQAMFPRDSRVIDNPNGTAPGIDLEVPRPAKSPCRVLAVPGVPAEMKEMWEATLAREIGQLGGRGRVIRRRRIHCFGAGESTIESMLPDLIRRGRHPTVGITASKTTITLRITAEGQTEQECCAAIEPTVATIRECLGNLVFGEEDDQLQDAVARLLCRQGKTLATAEWGTAGLVAEWFAGVPEAGDCYRGGIVVTGESILSSVLDIDPKMLQQHSQSGPEVAESMAVACRERFAADYAIAVGKFPMRDPAATEPPTISFGLADPDGVHIKTHPHAGHPALMKIFSAKRALNIVRLALLEAEP